MNILYDYTFGLEPISLLDEESGKSYTLKIGFIHRKSDTPYFRIFDEAGLLILGTWYPVAEKSSDCIHQKYFLLSAALREKIEQLIESFQRMKTFL